MKINLEDAAQILSMTPDELMLESQGTDLLNPIFVPATDMTYLADGRVQFDESGNPDATWEFYMKEILEYKKSLQETKTKLLAEDVSSAVKELYQ